MRTPEEKTQIARTIAEQIGAGALAMIGAKNLLVTDTGLNLKVGRNPMSVTHIQFDLTLDDLYTVTFSRCRKVKGTYKITELARVEMVFFDSLREVIEHNTGLYTSL